MTIAVVEQPCTMVKVGAVAIGVGLTVTIIATFELMQVADAASVT